MSRLIFDRRMSDGGRRRWIGGGRWGWIGGGEMAYIVGFVVVGRIELVGGYIGRNGE